MLDKVLFKTPRNPLETGEDTTTPAALPAASGARAIPCPECTAALRPEELAKNQKICPRCGAYFRMGARERLASVCDGGAFEELYSGIVSGDPLGFPGYPEKLERARRESGEAEGVVCATGSVAGVPVALFAMEPAFMLGSMGTALGEKVMRLFEHAARVGLPVVGFTCSGGARMQEGILSLMQMARTSGAVKLHGDGGNLYVCVLTDPTTGGVMASFAMQADIILAEPRAHIGFAGPRVIQQTMLQTLPEGFQRAEFLLEHGFVDAVVARGELSRTLGLLLKLHRKETV